MDMNELEKALKSIGKKSFVEDYDVYSDSKITKNGKVEILTKKYSENGATIRVSFAEKNFKHGKQNEALNIIVKSTRLDRNIITQAKSLLI